ncbi:hypothetical protein HYALB_00013512 [Hymenoscyphus albidus]|uniref:Transmembrane protein n=1 Tax=Hymenoscyphus albidus TaxID=595503 RepID=A0A9N9LUA3_9HELO|nr:hypothetical protein HYALB_00013512 [Hymenoscyphus albidus]
MEHLSKSHSKYIEIKRCTMNRNWFRLSFWRGQKETTHEHGEIPLANPPIHVPSDSSYAGILQPRRFPEGGSNNTFEPPLIAAFQPFNVSPAELPFPSIGGHRTNPPTLDTVVEAVELDGTSPIITTRTPTQPSQNEENDVHASDEPGGNDANPAPEASNLIAGDFEQPYFELFTRAPSPDMTFQPAAPRLTPRDLMFFNEPTNGVGTSTVPPVESRFTDTEKETGDRFYDTSKPNCTLNIVCYRSGARGCQFQKLQTAREDRFKSDVEFQKNRERIPNLIYSDRQFFEALREAYLGKMCGFWRRAVFLKSLRGIRLLSITPTTRPTIVPLDDFIIQEVLHAYQNPSTIETEHDWIDWVFRLRQPDRRHALEFVEGWNGTRIAIAGLMPLLVSCVLGVVWSWRTGDVQTAFTVAGFVLTAGTLVLALLAIISGIEASGRAST